MPSRPIDGGTSLRQSVEVFERLKHRRDEDLPPLPPELVRGAPGSVLSPEVVQPVEVVQAGPTPAQQVAETRQQLKEVVRKVRDQVAVESGELAPSSSTFPGLSDWLPNRG